MFYFWKYLFAVGKLEQLFSFGIPLEFFYLHRNKKTSPEIPLHMLHIVQNSIWSLSKQCSNPPLKRQKHKFQEREHSKGLANPSLFVLYRTAI